MLNFLRSPVFSRYVIAVIFIVAGLLHFLKTDAYINVMPEYIPFHKAMVLISGAAEVLGGIGILNNSIRGLAAWGLIVLLLAVFPANIEMAADAYRRHGWSFYFLLTLVRLPLQFVLIYWIYWACLKKMVS